MFRAKRAIFIIIIWIKICFCKDLFSQSISVTGDWVLTINQTNLQAGAGSDLDSTYTSITDQVNVGINMGKVTWTVYVDKSDINWLSNIQIYVRRRSSHGKKVTGGTSWQQVNLSSQTFFQGRRTVNNIKVQCGLKGVSLQIPPDTYTGIITYPVMEI